MTSPPVSADPEWVTISAGPFLMGSNEQDIWAAVDVCNGWEGSCEFGWFDGELPRRLPSLTAATARQAASWIELAPSMKLRTNLAFLPGGMSKMTVDTVELHRRPATMEDWARQQACSADIIERLHIMLAQAPDAVREWLALQHTGTPAAQFDHVYVLIAGTKPGE